MSDFKKLYKNPPSSFGKTIIIKRKFAQIQQEERDKSRTKILEKYRKKKYLPIMQNENGIKKLMEWKAKRARKKKEEELQKKPPFIVGKVHHKFFSPPIFLTNNKKDLATISKKKKVAQTDNKNTFKRGITKATEKRLKAKAAQKQEAPTTSSHTSKHCTSDEKSNNDKIESIDKQKSFAPPNYKFKPPAGLPSMPLFGEVFIESSPNENIIFSHDKLIENVSSIIQNHDNSDFIESIILKVSSDEDEDSNFLQNEQTEEKEEHSIKNLKGLLRKERDRLQKVCDEWMTIQSQDNITDDVRYQINQAVGQTTLLIKEKFEQFRQLCKDSKDNVAEMNITCTDLHGFWDMMYIQVKDCDSRFAKLDKLRTANWQEPLRVESPSARNKTIVKTLKQNSSQTSILASWKKKLAKIRDAKKHSQPSKVNDILTTPSISDKKAAALHKNLDVPCRRKLLESYNTHKMYTSTPFITMKVSKFYRPSDTLTSKMSQFNNESIDSSKFDKTILNKYSDRELSSSSNSTVSSTPSFQTIVETTVVAK